MRQFVAGILLALACVLAGLAAAWSAPERKIAPTFDALYREGQKARTAGDVERAIARFEAARSLQPRNADVLLALGVLYSWQKRYDQAEAALLAAKNAAPEYLDVRIALARQYGWQRIFDKAEAELDFVLSRRPDHPDALRVRGRNAYYRNDLDAAETAFRAVLRGAPEDYDALVGLGDVLRAKGDVAGARRAYGRAVRVRPGDEAAQDRMKALGNASHRWTVSTAFTYSHIARADRDPWREGMVEVVHAVHPTTSLRARTEISERFGLIDTYIEGAVDHRFADWLAGGVGAAGTPSADFRERWAVFGNANARVNKGGSSFGATVLLVDYRHGAYATGGVDTLKPGLQQHFWNGRFWLTGRAINIWDENGDYQPGWEARADVQAVRQLSVYAGLAESPETQENITVKTFTLFGGVRYAFSDRFSMRFDYAHEDREDAYIRHVFNVGLSVRF